VVAEWVEAIAKGLFKHKPAARRVCVFQALRHGLAGPPGQSNTLVISQGVSESWGRPALLLAVNHLPATVACYPFQSPVGIDRHRMPDQLQEG